MKYTIALDVGGSKIFSGIVANGKVSKTNRIKSGAHEGKDRLVANIMDAITALKPDGAAKICIGIAGQLDTERKILLQSPNFAEDTKHLPLKLILEKRFKKPVFLENDANCFALGEAVYGNGKGSNVVVGLTLGTGVGGGIILDSKYFINKGGHALRSPAKRGEGWVDKTIFRGENGVSGEFGHMVIVKDGEYCSCRKRGHFEAYIGGRSISAQYQKLTGKDLFFSDIFKRATGNDLNAQTIIRTAQEYLALLLVNIMHSVNPEIIVIGGGIGSTESFWQPAVLLAKQQLFFRGLEEIKIVPAALGENAALLGASMLKQ